MPKQAVLLAGCKGTGKTLVSQAIAYHTGAMWFDISPAILDGKYPGKEAVTMLHNVSPTSHVATALRTDSRYHQLYLCLQNDLRQVAHTLYSLAQVATS